MKNNFIHIIKYIVSSLLLFIVSYFFFVYCSIVYHVFYFPDNYNDLVFFIFIFIMPQIAFIAIDFFFFYILFKSNLMHKLLYLTCVFFPLLLLYNIGFYSFSDPGNFDGITNDALSNMMLIFSPILFVGVKFLYYFILKRLNIFQDETK